MKKIKLNQGQYALVDDEDFDELNKYQWRILKSGKNITYAVRNLREKGKNVKTISMHMQIMQTPKGMVTDHIDQVGLNNQKKNLRICTKSENGMNRGANKNNQTGTKGVYFRKDTKKWFSRIMLHRKDFYLGNFETKEEAEMAYKIGSVLYHGEFSKYADKPINFEFEHWKNNLGGREDHVHLDKERKYYYFGYNPKLIPKEKLNQIFKILGIK